MMGSTTVLGTATATVGAGNPSMAAPASKLQRDAGRAAYTRIRMEIEGGLLAIMIQ